MNLSLRSIASALGGVVVSGQVLAPGPNHSRKDRSLAIRPSAAAPGGLVINSFAGDDWRECRDHVLRRLGIDPRRASEPSPIERMNSRVMRRRDEVAEAAKQAERTASAVRLFSEACDPYGSPVEAYLQSRRISLPKPHAGEWVRFHPACPFAGERTPAMVCLGRDMLTDEPKAVHRTAINNDGHGIKINGHKRLSLGPMGGAAVKITSHNSVREDLGIGEGIETALSLPLIRQFGNLPVWSLLSVGNFGKLPMFSGLRRLWIATDHDPAGMKAAQELARRWRADDREARLFIPTIPGLDLNDLAMGGRLA